MNTAQMITNLRRPPQIRPDLIFTIPGPARGKGRPRIGKIGNHARMFTDKKTANYETLVSLAAAAALHGEPPFDCPVVMHVLVRVEPAASASRPVKALMLSGEHPPAKKPDLDNVIKAVLDGLNGIGFRDDVLVVELTASKVYAPTSGVDVLIKPYVCERAA